jgi:hypothetical protein
MANKRSWISQQLAVPASFLGHSVAANTVMSDASNSSGSSSSSSRSSSSSSSSSKTHILVLYDFHVTAACTRNIQGGGIAGVGTDNDADCFSTATARTGSSGVVAVAHLRSKSRVLLATLNEYRQEKEKEQQQAGWKQSRNVEDATATATAAAGPVKRHLRFTEPAADSIQDAEVCSDIVYQHPARPMQDAEQEQQQQQPAPQLTQQQEQEQQCRSPFTGCLDPSKRSLYLSRSTTEPVPCGFLAPNSLDHVRAAYSRDSRCRYVVFTTLFYAYWSMQNPNPNQPADVCYVLVVDRMTVAQASKMLLQVVKPESPWEVFVIHELPHPNPAKSVKIVKLLGPRLFPNAEWVIYSDAKVRVGHMPHQIFDDIDQQVAQHHTLPLGILHHPVANRTTAAEFVGTKARLESLYKAGKLRNLTEDLEDLEAQLVEYTNEGFFDPDSVANKVGYMVDSCVLIFRNTPCIRRFFCAWMDESVVYSHREQVSHVYVSEKLQVKTAYIPKNLEGIYF